MYHSGNYKSLQSGVKDQVKLTDSVQRKKLIVTTIYYNFNEKKKDLMIEVNIK